MNIYLDTLRETMRDNIQSQIDMYNAYKAPVIPRRGTPTCPECLAPWDTKNNRCTANCQKPLSERIQDDNR